MIWLQLTWLLDDNGIPATWRHLEGYGVNTFVFVNSEGKETYVKTHWRPTIGMLGLKPQT